MKGLRLGGVSARDLLRVFGLLGILSSCAPYFTADSGVEYRRISFDAGGPVTAHLVSFDLAKTQRRFHLLQGGDVDGSGPGVASLLMPQQAARSTGALYSFNSSFFTAPPDPEGSTDSLWLPGKPVIPLGTVIYRGQDLNPLRGSSHCFWIDGLGQAHIEAESSLPTSGIYLALGGFGRLLNSGSLVPSAGGTKAPRTILGIDGTGTRLWIAVIDGRQPGYSVGLTLEESAQFLLDHTGAVEALNMDGGGSSSFVSLLASGEHLVMNRPSDVIGPRAVAVYLQYY